MKALVIRHFLLAMSLLDSKEAESDRFVPTSVVAGGATLFLVTVPPSARSTAQTRLKVLHLVLLGQDIPIKKTFLRPWLDLFVILAYPLLPQHLTAKAPLLGRAVGTAP